MASKRKRVHPVRKSKARPRARQSQQPIVMRTPEPLGHRYDLNAEQVALIKRTIAKGATDDELQLFLWVAKRHRLDPFTRQLHLVKRWDKNAANADGSKGAMVATIQIGIDGYRQMASRYPDFGSVSEAEYEMAAGTSRNPISARVRVFKKGLPVPSVGVAFWDEYGPDLTQPAAFMWKKMPKHMLAKCAEAIALRKAYPDLADIYTVEEMARTNLEYTGSGRKIVGPEHGDTSGMESVIDVNPHLAKYLEREAEGMKKLTPAQKEIVAQKLQAAEPSLFWTRNPENETYEIMGADSLKTANKDLLGPLWSPVAKTIIANAAQFGKLLSQFEDRKVPFKELGRKPGE